MGLDMRMYIYTSRAEITMRKTDRQLVREALFATRAPKTTLK